MWALWPISTPGRPGTLTPVTDRPGADSATWYQMEGTVCGRCGSPASIDFAPETLGPLAAQALLSGNSWMRPGGSASVCASMAAAAVATPAVPGPDAGASAGVGPLTAAVVDVVDAWPAWGAMGARPRWW